MENRNQILPELTIRIFFRSSGTPTALIDLVGKISKKSAELLVTAFNECMSQKKYTIIVDMNKISVIDNAAWKSIVYEKKKLSNNQVEIFLFGLQPDLEANVLKICTKNNDSLKIYTSITECQKEIEFYEEYKSSHQPVQPSTATIDKQSVSEHDPLTSDPEPHQNNSGIRKLPIAEKIIAIISKYGPCSALKILSYLKSEEFDYTDINVLQLTRILNDMDLNSWEKRERFYRSC
jgi:anti-anti-sigma factor